MIRFRSSIGYCDFYFDSVLKPDVGIYGAGKQILKSYKGFSNSNRFWPKNVKWYYMPILRNLLPQLIKNRMIKAAHTLRMICNCSKSRNTIRTCSKTYNIFLIPFPGFSTYVKHLFKKLVVLRICQKYLSRLEEVQEFY